MFSFHHHHFLFFIITIITMIISYSYSSFYLFIFSWICIFLLSQIHNSSFNYWCKALSIYHSINLFPLLWIDNGYFFSFSLLSFLFSSLLCYLLSIFLTFHSISISYFQLYPFLLFIIILFSYLMIIFIIDNSPSSQFLNSYYWISFYHFIILCSFYFI